MQRRSLMLSAFLPLLATPAVGQTLRERFAATGAGASAFVEFATISDNFEIESSRFILTRTAHQQIREFAERMIAHHTMTSNQLRALPEASTRLPASFDERQADRLAVLRQQQDLDMLNRYYVQQQVEAHEEALEIYRLYASSGDVPALRSFAERNVPIITQHLAAARALQAPVPPSPG